jgi:hypothetical protein
MATESGLGRENPEIDHEPAWLAEACQSHARENNGWISKF